MFMKRLLVAATTLALVVTLTGCGDSDPKSDPTPSPTVAPTTPAPTSASWRDKYTSAQLKRYDAALGRWQSFWTQTNAVKQKGIDTPGVKAMYEEYSMTAVGDYAVFKNSYADHGARIEVPPVALWARAREIGTSWVVIEQCTDYSKVRVTVNGDPVPQRGPDRRFVVVKMSKPQGHDWMKAPSKDEGGKACPSTE